VKPGTAVSDDLRAGAAEQMPTAGEFSGEAAPVTMDTVLTRRAELVRLAYRFCWSREDAEDAVQQALFLAARRDHQLAHPAKLWAWVQAIVIRQCHDLLRRGRRHAKGTGDGDPPRLHTTQMPEGAAVDPEELDRLRCAIAELPERQQTAIVLRHLEGMPYDRIAELMGVSESTARVHVRNARESLRRTLQSSS